MYKGNSLILSNSLENKDISQRVSAVLIKSYQNYL